MTLTPRAIDRRRFGILIAVALLAGMVGCGDYQVDLGPTIPDDATCPFGSGLGQASLTFLDGSGAVERTLPVTGAQVLLPLVVIHAQQPNFGEGNLTVRAWVDGVGPYRCEDPSTAGRTRIVGFGSPSGDGGSVLASWGVSTLSGGTCAISVAHFPGGDGPSLSGSFTASGGEGPGPFSGSFFIENPCP